MEIINRKAQYDYYIEDTISAGVVLTGTEIKSLRSGKANIKDSYVIIKNNEAYLLNSNISSYEKGNRFNHDEKRTRKLLLNKKEILKIKEKIEISGYTVVPLKIYFQGPYAKVLIGIAKGKKNYDKKEVIKQRDLEREMKKMIKWSKLNFSSFKLDHFF